jgi:toxin YoeB
MIEYVSFTRRAMADYRYWQDNDKKTLSKVNQIILDTQRNGYGGIGKSEPLRGNLSGYWSKRIDDKKRLVFKIADDTLVIYQCRGHYDD